MNIFKSIRLFLLPDYTKRHWELYRRAQTAQGLSGKLLRMRIERIQRRYNASIPVRRAITPFETPHQLNGIFISLGATIGEGCTIFHQVTVGSITSEGSKRFGAPTIGRNVYIGAGAKVIGNVKIGDNVRIGANCVVVDDVPDNATVVMPKPRVLVAEVPPDNTYHHWKD